MTSLDGKVCLPMTPAAETRPACLSATPAPQLPCFHLAGHLHAASGLHAQLGLCQNAQGGPVPASICSGCCCILAREPWCRRMLRLPCPLSSCGGMRWCSNRGARRGLSTFGVWVPSMSAGWCQSR